jgi:hypothetical protein
MPGVVRLGLAAGIALAAIYALMPQVADAPVTAAPQGSSVMPAAYAPAAPGPVLKLDRTLSRKGA